ncbi:MAG TPA: ATP-binding protein [Candidatus Sulfotelmatobacter sp.]|nr:ATP-binding protein [Candidatus Sulfotelmatobacter sp.]
MSAVSSLKWIREDSEGEFCSFFDLAPVGLAQCRRPGVVTALNPALERMLGGPLDLGLQLTLLDLIRPGDRDYAERQLKDLFDGKQDSIEVESASNGPFGASSWNVWRVSDRDGLADAAMAMVRAPQSAAIDDHLQQVARLESMARLAGGVAHDFNNILTGLLLYCDLLINSLESNHRSRKYAEEILQAGMQASALVRQLLTLSRPAKLSPAPLSLNGTATSICNLLEKLIGDKVQLTFRFDRNLGLVKLDETQAQQILLNLVLNARDAMPSGGHILIETRNCKLQALTETVPGTNQEATLPCAQLVVEDDGCGMDPFTLAHMFEPFFTTKAGKGTGLGLATVHDIIKSNGGLIHVSSEPGRGTRVSIFLPLVPGITTEFVDNGNFHPQLNGEICSSQNEE